MSVVIVVKRCRRTREKCCRCKDVVVADKVSSLQRCRVGIAGKGLSLCLLSKNVVVVGNVSSLQKYRRCRQGVVVVPLVVAAEKGHFGRSQYACLAVFCLTAAQVRTLSTHTRHRFCRHHRHRFLLDFFLFFFIVFLFFDVGVYSFDADYYINVLF